VALISISSGFSESLGRIAHRSRLIVRPVAVKAAFRASYWQKTKKTWSVDMSRIHSECSDSDPADTSVAAAVLLRQEPDEEEDDEENEGDDNEDDDDEDTDDGYSVSLKSRAAAPMAVFTAVTRASGPSQQSTEN